ncbi:hypothetical protein [Vagococcus xieshaowenii]|uniref:Uncharacterized protein n=1 Tax=Vagococcus xieshaowenii TaxID=2562451 RepID=A0AAJ5EFS1_9ENTE|nr:hypothetical protein [Vagococcus xieshaowenii]QCA29694.1 hypothetical protein E4Z98_09925 [Vagococcus xieshaowenii]TFZ42909.1 hypothetical protein E4031_01360 [Vagococcus xieshaowenii]
MKKYLLIICILLGSVCYSNKTEAKVINNVLFHSGATSLENYSLGPVYFGKGNLGKGRLTLENSARIYITNKFSSGKKYVVKVKDLVGTIVIFNDIHSVCHLTSDYPQTKVVRFTVEATDDGNYTRIGFGADNHAIFTGYTIEEY